MQSIQDELILDDPERGVVLPQVKYHTYARITQETVFKGAVIPVPPVIIPYLKGTELKIFMLILSEIRDHAMCFKSQTEIGEILGITNIAVSHSTRNLVNMGIIKMLSEGAAKHNSRRKIIDWGVLEKLEKFFKNCKPDAAQRLREYVGEKRIDELTDDQLEWFRMNCCISDDPEENEEYR